LSRWSMSPIIPSRWGGFLDEDRPLIAEVGGAIQ
jgi:hypothetical protein